MEFRILGSLEVLDGEGQAVVVAGRARALLALLLLRANETASIDRLVDELWGERAPASARKIVQNLVSQLRKTLGDRLETRGQGYRLRVEPGELDLGRFRRLVEAASRARAEHDPGAAAERLREALALWRGPALADFAYEELPTGAAAHLDELRLTALEERIDAELALGRDGALVGELERLVAEQPLRERLRGELMLALYRAGRQADALAAYRQARTDLVEQLGLEPGEELQRLEQAILRHDPALEAPAPVAPAPRRPRLRRRPAALAAAGLLLLLAAAAAALLELGRGERSVVPIAPDSVAVVDPRSGRVLAAIEVGSRPVAVAAGAGAVWVANANDGTVSRIDPRTRKVVETIGTGAPASDVAVGAGSVWVASGGEGTLLRIDPRTDAVVDTIDLSGPDDLAPTGVYSVATAGDAVWVGSGSGSVLKIDPGSGKVVRRAGTEMTPVDVALGGGSLWVVNIGARVLRVDPATGSRTGALAAAANARALAFGAGAVWITDVSPTGGGLVWRIDPATVTSLGGPTRLAQAPDGLTTGGGSVWVAGGASGALIEIDPESGDVARSIPVGSAPLDVAYADGELWVAVGTREAASP